jgi:hypothetical protein
MEYILIYVIIFILIYLIIKIFINLEYKEYLLNIYGDKSIIINDKNYFDKFSKNNIETNDIFINLYESNKLNVPIKKKNKILFITFENRKYQPNDDYVDLHNKNIEMYVKKYSYEYKFYNNCDQNKYWCKIFMVIDALENTLEHYDYVVWLDSDTYIKNFSIDLNDILNNYRSDIFFGSDNNTKYNLVNSGIFIIKNSQIGKNYLYECLNSFNDKCIKKDGNLYGRWAATCYEQGIMNLVMIDKFSKYTTILPNNIIFNHNTCSKDVFLIHLYASKPSQRINCFLSK